MNGSGIEEVAKLAGVSIATVSRVFSNKQNVRKATRERVLLAATQLGYRPSRVARTLRSQRSRALGLIISDIENPFFTSIVRAVEDIAHQHDYSVLLCNADEDTEKELVYVELLVSDQVAGVILSPSANSHQSYAQLTEANIPVVVIDRKIPDVQVDTVLVENLHATRQLISHLIEHGHTRIAAVLGTPNVFTGSERQTGYIDAFIKNRLPIDEALILTGIPKVATGYALTNQLLALPERPTAIFTGNNLLTIGALRAIHEYNLSIPGDIALVAFDEMDWMFVMNPPLSVVSQPTYEMGRQAVNLLLNRIDDNQRPFAEIILQPKLIFRGSSGAH